MYACLRQKPPKVAAPVRGDEGVLSNRTEYCHLEPGNYPGSGRLFVRPIIYEVESYEIL